MREMLASTGYCTHHHSYYGRGERMLRSEYRVVVKARASSRARDFVWEIVQRKDQDKKTVAKSIRAFKTMEDAYISGKAALEKHNKRT